MLLSPRGLKAGRKQVHVSQALLSGGNPVWQSWPFAPAPLAPSGFQMPYMPIQTFSQLVRWSRPKFSTWKLPVEVHKEVRDA